MKIRPLANQVVKKLPVALRNFADGPKNKTRHYNLESTPSILRLIIIFQHNLSPPPRNYHINEEAEMALREQL